VPAGRAPAFASLDLIFGFAVRYVRVAFPAEIVRPEREGGFLQKKNVPSWPYRIVDNRIPARGSVAAITQ
jgi:hypothetical protein